MGIIEVRNKLHTVALIMGIQVRSDQMSKQKSLKAEKKTKGFSIRTKLNLAFFLVIFISITILGTIVFINVQAALKDKLLTTSTQVLGETGRYIETYMRSF